jgi:hypothetical protein
VTPRYVPERPTNDRHWRVLDRRFNSLVENGNGSARRFFSLEAAERFADGLNRGNRRPAGARA